MAAARRQVLACLAVEVQARGDGLPAGLIDDAQRDRAFGCGDHDDARRTWLV